VNVVNSILPIRGILMGSCRHSGALITPNYRVRVGGGRWATLPGCGLTYKEPLFITPCRWRFVRMLGRKTPAIPKPGRKPPGCVCWCSRGGHELILRSCYLPSAS